MNFKIGVFAFCLWKENYLIVVGGESLFSFSFHFKFISGKYPQYESKYKYKNKFNCYFDK